MVVPQQLTSVTLGARDLPLLRDFYAAIGWQERDGSSDDFTTYRLGSTLLALYPLELLAAEAAPGETPPDVGWNGVTLGVNVVTAEAVDDVFEGAVAAGATVVGRPVRREWGGYSGYLADPEGNRWEIAWAPGF